MNKSLKLRGPKKDIKRNHVPIISYPAEKKKKYIYIYIYYILR